MNDYQSNETQPKFDESKDTAPNRLILSLIALAIVGGLILYYSLSQKRGTTSSQSGNTAVETKTPDRIIEVTGAPFAFNPAEIRVKLGERVRIVFFNAEGNHNWALDEFNTKSDVIAASETTSVEFVADKIGQFEYYCGVGNHRAQGMKGTLIIE